MVGCFINFFVGFDIDIVEMFPKLPQFTPAQMPIVKQTGVHALFNHPDLRKKRLNVNVPNRILFARELPVDAHADFIDVSSPPKKSAQTLHHITVEEGDSDDTLSQGEAISVKSSQENVEPLQDQVEPAQGEEDEVCSLST